MPIMVYHDISKEKMQGVLDSFPQESRKDGGLLNPSILSGFTPASQRVKGNGQKQILFLFLHKNHP